MERVWWLTSIDFDWQKLREKAAEGIWGHDPCFRSDCHIRPESIESRTGGQQAENFPCFPDQ